MKLNKIVPRNENFADWYTSVIQSSKLITYASVKGTVNYLPRGWAIWTNIVNELDRRLKTSGAENVQLPLFIRTSDFLKEVDQVEGFAPETFIVDKMGSEKIEDPLIVRPTSEVLFSQLFKDQIMSYKDLPLKYNQWCSVYRAEKTTKPFLRGSEFFWQELHAMFESKETCEEYVLQIHKLYNDFLKYVLCLPVLSGKKTEGEKFPGAVDTYTREVWSQDCQCIQAGTSHYLGTNFSKMYDVKFQDKNNGFSMPHYMSAGMTTRLIGCLIVVHGDDKGLVLPFGIAPVQISILTMFANKEPKVLEKARQIQSELSKYLVKIDDSDSGFGYKMSEQEINGVPFSIAIGPRDLESGTAMLIRRDNSEKQTVKFDNLKATIEKQIIEYNTNLYEKAKKHMNDSIVEVSNIEEFNNAIADKKIVLAHWCGIEEEEAKLKLATNGVTPRCVKEECATGTCFFTGKPAKQLVYFARAY